MSTPPPLSPMLEELATLRMQIRTLRLVMHHMPDVMGGAYDLQGNLQILIGPPILNVTAKEGTHYTKFLPEDRKEKFLWLFGRAKTGLESSIDYPIGERVFEATARPIYDEKETLQLVLIYVLDVTAERIATAALKQRQRDTLTGLPKRSVLHAFVDGLIGRSAIFHVLCIDLDNFKKVNDEHGHDVGDRLLERVSNELRSAVRSHDLACRQGGDEFTVILTATNAPLDASKRILQRVLVVAAEFGAGASCGFASYPVDGLTFEAVMKVADNCLRASKNAGKGRVSGSISGTFEVHLPVTAPPPAEVMTAPPPASIP